MVHFNFMKRIILSLAILLTVGYVFGQNKQIAKLKKIKGVEYICINKESIKNAISSGEGIHVGNLINFESSGGPIEGLDEVVKKFNNIQIVTTTSDEAAIKLKKEVEGIVKKDYALLISGHNDGQKANVYQGKNGNGLLVLGEENDTTALVVISGNFSLKDLIGKNNTEDEEQDYTLSSGDIAIDKEDIKNDLKWSDSNINTDAQPEITDQTSHGAKNKTVIKHSTQKGINNVDKLFAKYKATSKAEYKETTEETKHNLQESSDNNDSIYTGIDIQFIMKELKKAETLTLQLDSIQLEELSEDIKALKGFTCYTKVNHNVEPEETGTLLGNMWNQMMTPEIKVQLYGKTKGKYMTDILARIDCWGKVALAHHEGKVKTDDVKKLMATDLNVVINKDNNDNIVEWKDIKKELDNKNVLVVINGKEYPNLHSEKEADIYMKENGISFNNESFVVGISVKEKYPDTDKKVVIEYVEKEETK